MPELRLHFLGSPQVEYAGKPVEIRRRKALALLAYLAVTGRPHTREALAALLWPDYEQSSALAYLRRALWTLNQTPVGQWIAAEREVLSFEPDAEVWLDVEAFGERLEGCEAQGHGPRQVCAICQPRLEEAVELYPDDFLAGFGLEDSAAFDEWQFFQTESLRQALTGALERLVHCHAEAGDLEEALRYARRWLHLDDLNEAVHRTLMRLYARTGQRTLALRQYEACVRSLKEGLNLAPSAETVSLYRSIRSGEGVVSQPDMAVPQASPPPSESRPVPPPPPGSASPSPPRRRLPLPSTPFVGRQVELERVQERLLGGECRLLTLLGPGGMGKTRLAIESARGLPPAAFPDGIFFVPLAPLTTPGLLVQAIADALDFPFFQRESESSQEQLLNFLREKRLLLVLDNFEQLLAGAELLASIVEGAPGVTLLVTSRERLNLHGEWVYELAGMRLPESVNVEGWADYGALQLFVQSAQRAAGHFELTDENRAAVVRICRLVEGVPLGIELAASWVRLLAPQEIISEIETSLDFLTTSLRDLPERHQSLRAVFEHSWNLLEARERALFAQLALFRGGFTREAAQAVTGASLLQLSGLVDKSVLRREPTGRYELHELLRQYAAEKLEQDPALAAQVRKGHAAYYLEWLARLEIDFKGAGQVEAAERVALDLENVRVAWYWASIQCMLPALRGAAVTLFLFCDMRSRFHDGEALFNNAVEGICSPEPKDEDGRALLGLLLVLQGWFARRLYKRAEGERLTSRGLDLLESLEPRWELALAYQLGVFATPISPELALERFQEALEIYQAHGDRWGEALILESMGTLIFYRERDYKTARTYLEESLEIRRKLGDRWGMAMVLFTLGILAQDRGGRREAERYYHESFDLRWQIGDPWGTAICLDYLGYVLRRMGEYERARELHERSLIISRQIGDYMGIGGSLDNLGMVAYDEGYYEEALRYFEEGLAERQKAEERYSDIAFSLEHLGDVHLALGDLDLAEEYYAESLEKYGASGFDVHWGFVRAYHGEGRLARLRGDDQRARERFALALKRGLDSYAYSLVLEVFVSVAALRLDEGRPLEALELLGAIVDNEVASYQTEQAAQELLAQASAQLDEESARAALERGREAELPLLIEQTVAKLES
ncbi:MAG: AfsR/SARP family transcriptional regulator [Anaerolineales bacterium]